MCKTCDTPSKLPKQVCKTSPQKISRYVIFTMTHTTPSDLRTYDDTTNQAVREHYRKMRIHQSITHIQSLSAKYNTLTTPMTVWEAIDSLDKFIDVSDPDVNMPNLVHLFQTAEGIRTDGHPDWLQLTGLIHDLGKCIYLRGCDRDGTSVKEQWGIVGDTYVLGVDLPDTLVFPEFNSLSPDKAKYSTKTGIYIPNCGLDRCQIAYGHDEYMYQVLRQNPGVSLPTEALSIIRYHSLYPWHSSGEYQQLESQLDREMKPWVQLFNRYDLYTKHDKTYTDAELSELREYYDGLIKKYLPDQLLW